MALGRVLVHSALVSLWRVLARVGERALRRPLVGDSVVGGLSEG
jgi:hypothetical protein